MKSQQKELLGYLDNCLMNNYTIRPSKPNDYPVILQIWLNGLLQSIHPNIEIEATVQNKFKILVLR